MKAIIHKLSCKPGDTFTLKPCFDWHVGDVGCDIAAIKHYLKQDVDNPRALIVGGGDMAASILPGDKRYTKNSDASEGTAAIIDEQLDQLEDLLSPYKGRILGLGTGNHEETIRKRCGTHMMRRLAKRLGTVSLGYQWAVTLRFNISGTTRSIVIFGQHGWGGGSRTAGGSITKYARHADQYEADLFFYGHDHKREAHVTDFMGIQGELFIPKQKRIFFPGTFQRTFSDNDEPSWAETRGFTPVTLEGLNVYIKTKRVGGVSRSIKKAPTALRNKQQSAFPFEITSDL